MRHQRRVATHEHGGEFRNIIPVGAFLDVLEIIESKADHLAGVRDRQRIFQTFQRDAWGSPSLLGQLGNRLEIATVLSQPLAEIARQLGIYSLQIDPLIAFDYAKMGGATRFKRNDLHRKSSIASRD